MKKPTFSRIVFIALLLIFGLESMAQNYVPFVPRYDQAIKGDMLLIGNNNLSRHKTDAYNSNTNNEHRNNRDRMVYVDIDNDGSTFNSSSANLKVPSDTNCYQVVYAALYWTAVVKGDTPMSDIKFKTPESGGYIDITGEEIYYQNSSDNRKSNAYVYYKDVTDIIGGLSDADGTYTVANISSTTSAMMTSGRNQEGLSAGWSLFVIYEDPLLPSKYITSFDGFTKINNTGPVVDRVQTFDINGFRTIPVGPVRAKYAFSALEGDRNWSGDYLEINGARISATTAGGSTIRPSNNFFNSTVSIVDPITNGPIPFTDRNPASQNTLGFDAGIIDIPNAGNSVIGNGDTSATIELGTNTDIYYFYFNAFAIEIIAPKIILTKIVEDPAGNDIGGQLVNLGDELNYVIGFQNVGNDDAKNLVIRDVLPQNIDFNYPEDMGLLPPGVDVQSYNPATRELVFSVDNSIVEMDDPVKEIRFKVTVVKTCSLLNDACSNIISNQAYSTYQGTDNPDFFISDDPSFSSNTGCLLTPGATNFLADITCDFEEEVILCGTSVTLTAGEGYDAYSWSTSPTGSPVIGTSREMTVKNPGTYYVHNTAAAPCQSIDQRFVVVTYGENTVNPLIPFSDEVVTCVDDGKPLPNFFLCGANDIRNIETNITDTSSIIWEKLDEASCSALPAANCANEDSSCQWNEVASGPNYNIGIAGQYRITLNYEGGCFSQYYFNVYSNILEPTATSKDIMCDVLGEIVVGGVPNGYEFSIDGANYQTSNEFSIGTPGVYSVYVKQIGVDSSPCIFSVPDIQIRERNFSGTAAVTQPLCHGDKGSVKLSAQDVGPQYFYSLSKGGTLINEVGPLMESDYSFKNLKPGSYSATISTEDGCLETVSFDIVEPELLTATSAITRPLLACDYPDDDDDDDVKEGDGDSDGSSEVEVRGGIITVSPTGGTAPYYYFVNGATEFQSEPEIVVTASGTYTIKVVDANNCSTETTIQIEETPAPVFDVTATDILCADPNSGTITVDVTNANGTTLKYSIDGGDTFVNSSSFSGLTEGDYEVVVQYTIGTASCWTDPQSVTVAPTIAIEGVATLEAPYTCDSTGEITVSGVSGGTAPYTYSIDGVNFQASPTFTNLTTGTYTVTVKDAIDCAFATNSIVIEALDPPTNLAFDDSQITCPTNTSDITITNTTGGTGTLEYQIIAPAAAATAYQTSTTFAGLAPGTYTFQVKDANDCTYSESYTIAPLPTVKVQAQPINDETCYGAEDGSARVTVSGTTDFTYTINGGPAIVGTSPIELTGLAAGTHTIVVTDTLTNCDATAAVDIKGSTSALSLSTATESITCLESGSVKITTVGGWGGKTYSLTLPDGTVLPAQAKNTFSNLTQDGTYTVSVTDAKNCVVTETFQLSNPDEIVASISTDSNFCYDDNTGATIEVDVTTGQAPFEYSINGSAFQNSNSFSNLVPGSYTIMVRDAYGCDFTLPAELIEPTLAMNTVFAKDLDCTASSDAEITGEILGGYAPFTHEVSFDGGAYTTFGTNSSSFVYHTDQPGTYQFKVTDAQGCTVESGMTTIDPLSPPAISAVVQTQNILCYGEDNGAIKVTVDTSVGTAPFVINIYNDTTGTDYGTQTSGLPAGEYTVTVTDAKSCTVEEKVTIDQPDAIELTFHSEDISCDTSSGNVSKGAVIIDAVTGGTPPYNYFVTGTNGYNESELNANGSTSYTFDVVDFGLYEINVVDANGCSVLEQDVLVASPPDELNIDIKTTVDCANGGEAVVSVGTALASEGPFYFSTYPATGTAPGGSWIAEDAVGSKSTTFTNLTPGVTYTFIVYDESTGCSHYEIASDAIPTNSELEATAVSSNNITCTGSADGTVSFTIKSPYGSDIAVDYEIFNSLSLTTTGISGSDQVSANGSLDVTDLGPLPFGNYYVLISETSGPNSGCSVITVPFNITESAIPLSLSTSIDQNANCNANSGMISAVGRDGTAPYTYQLTTSVTAPSATDAAWASANTFNRDAGDYYVHVKDAYGCIVSSPIVVLRMDPTPVITLNVTNQCDTADGNFEIEVTLPTEGISPYRFSINGGAFQTKTAPFTISNLNSGTHTVEVMDANGCGNLETITIERPIGITPAITALPTCANDDGEITISAVGGSGNYNYAISPNAGSVLLSGNVFSGVPSGDYTITVTDANTLCSVDVAITLKAATPVTFTADPTHVSCFGGSDGSITVSLPDSNDNPVYTYAIIAGPTTVAAQSSKVFTELTAGTYTVEVTSGRGCSLTQDVTITEPDLLEVAGVATDFACSLDNSVNASTLTITASGGTTDYVYSIDGINYFTTNTFEIIDTGVLQTINISVKDANGCIATDSVPINPLPELTTAIAVIATPIDCEETGSVKIEVTGGSGNFLYQMLPEGTPQASDTFSVTAPGDYYFQVTDVTTGCYIETAVFTVDPFDVIDVVATPTTAVSCFGSANGALEIDVSGYSGNYTYEVLDSAGASVIGPTAANTTTNPQVINGLIGGNYTVVVTETDSPFCATVTNVVTIASPATPLTLQVSETSNVTCDDDQGTITALAKGGWGSYEYELTGDATVAYSPNGTFTGLSAGDYIINVRDAGGCEVSEPVTLLAPTPIAASFAASATILPCFGDQNASITVSNVTGGQGSNYTYTLNRVLPTVSSSGPQTAPVFNGLGAGTYNVTITDGYNCSLNSVDIVIEEPTAIEADLVAVTTPTCTTQASLTLSASGGTGLFSYSESSTFTNILGTFTSSITFDVPAGSYKYYVRDANGCVATVTNDIKIDPLPPLTVSLSATDIDINCYGDDSGVIRAVAQGGLGNYTYTLQDGSRNPIASAVQNTPGVFTQLTSGTYYVHVESGDCAETSARIEIKEPTQLVVADPLVSNVNCFGEDNGSVEITATGGTGKIKYAISPKLNQFFEKNVFENLAPGTYDILVQDEAGCFEIVTVTINEPDAVILSIVPSSIVDEICAGDEDAMFSVTISGGTGPYSVSLDDYEGVYTTGTDTQNQFDFTNLNGGEHTVFVRDSEGCESEWNITLEESVKIDPVAVIEYPCENNAPSNRVTVKVDESVEDLSELDFSLNGGAFQPSNVFNNIVPGIGHYVDVRHTNGCITRTDLFDIGHIDPLSLLLTDGDMNQIVATAAGGTEGYQFTLNGEDYGSTNTFIITKSGDYTVTVTDSSGCYATATRYFEFIPLCIPNYFTPNGNHPTWAPGCDINYPNIEFRVFDRYGREVGTYRQGESWDGKYKNRDLPTGDYWYIINLNDGKDDRDFVGHFTLYR